MPTREIVDSGVSEALTSAVVIARRVINKARLAGGRRVFVSGRLSETTARCGSGNLK